MADTLAHPPAAGNGASQAEEMTPDDLWVVGAALVHDGRVLAARRAPHVADRGLWELPGGKPEAGESATDALRRELREELSLEIKVGKFLGRGTARRTDGRHILLDVYLAASADDKAPSPGRLIAHDAIRWLAADELSTVDWAAADRPLLPDLAAALRRDAQPGDASERRMKRAY
ncbi:MAG: (deoxy)nucleoside triphosphate pyrophosphohydrolase [Acidobacteriota bacterium]